MDTKKKDVMDALLEEDQANSNETHLKIIKTTKDLMILGKYCLWNSDFSQEVKKTAHLRLENDMDALLQDEDDVDTLVNLYDSLYWCLDKHRNRIANRLRVLFQDCQTLEEFEPIFEKKSEMNLWQDQDNPCIYPAFDERMAELVCTDPRSNSFLFLLKHIKGLSYSKEPRSRVARLMPAALKKQYDLEKIHGFFSSVNEPTTHNDWNGWSNEESEAVRSRIVEIVKERVPKCATFEDLKDLCRYASYHTRVNTFVNSHTYLPEKRNKDRAELFHLLDEQSEKIVSRETSEVKMEHFYPFIAIYAPSRALSLGGKRLPGVESIFSEKIAFFLNRDIPNMKSMKDYSLYLHELCGEDRFSRRFPNELKILVDAILLQVSGVRKTLFSLSEILYCYQLSQDKRFAQVILDRIPLETDPQNLVCFDTDIEYDFFSSIREKYDFWELAKSRLREQISKLSKPTEFFLECIEKKKFFGFKEVFIDKVKEFKTS